MATVRKRTIAKPKTRTKTAARAKPTTRTTPNLKATQLPVQAVLHDLGVEITVDPFWIHLRSTSPAPYEITGKYLFYSPDSKQLDDVALNEIARHGFHRAKRSAMAMSGEDYVLCLYYSDDSRKVELAKRARSDHGWQCEPDSTFRWETESGKGTNLRYRWWKSDQETIDGEYSEEFVSSLPPELRAVVDERKAKAAARKKSGAAESPRVKSTSRRPVPPKPLARAKSGDGTKKPSDVHRKFAAVVTALSTEARVTHGGKGFGSTGLKMDGKIFAMVSSKGLFVVKLPKERVTELVNGGKGDYFEPGRGKLMKEWFAATDGTTAFWTRLAKEARRFVSARLRP